MVGYRVGAFVALGKSVIVWMKVRRLLIVTTEPPPTSSGLGTFWGKLCVGAVGGEFAVDFLGPDPELCSPFGASGLPVCYGCVGLGSPPISRRASVGRNRTTGLRRMCWSGLRAPFALAERMLQRNFYLEWIVERTERLLPRILNEGRYDSVAVLPPPLELAVVVRDAARTAGLPFIHIVGDPIGHRRVDGSFLPAQVDIQRDLMATASAVFIAEPTHRRYYSNWFDLPESRVVFLSDLFLPRGSVEERTSPFSVADDAILHFGQVSRWRSIDGLVDAICELNSSEDAVGRSRSLVVIGPIEDAASRARAAGKLGYRFENPPLLSYLDARAAALSARQHVVIVSPEHRDNVPSKLIDSLAFGRPILVLCHPDSAAGEIVRNLGVGVVSDVRSTSDILRGLRELGNRFDEIEESYQRNARIREWNCFVVGARFKNRLFEVMNW